MLFVKVLLKKNINKSQSLKLELGRSSTIIIISSSTDIWIWFGENSTLRFFFFPIFLSELGYDLMIPFGDRLFGILIVKSLLNLLF